VIHSAFLGLLLPSETGTNDKIKSQQDGRQGSKETKMFEIEIPSAAPDQTSLY
jgi:hypothetical protein